MLTRAALTFSSSEEGLVGGCRRVVVLRVFVKKTQRTPSHEVELALSWAKEVLG